MTNPRAPMKTEREVKLARARVKPVEFMPGWAACCDDRGAQVKAVVGTNLLLDMSTKFVADTECPDCGRYVKDTKYVVDVDGNIHAFEWLDLDEGEFCDAR